MTKEQLCDKILKVFVNSDISINLLDISKQLSIKSNSAEYEKLKEALALLVEQGVLDKSSRRRYSLVSRARFGALKGIVNIENDFAYVVTDDASYPIVYVPNNFLNTALNGDLVLVKLILQGKKKKKVRGEIIEVLERHNLEITGTIEFDGYFYFLRPEQKSFKLDFLIPAKELHGARAGDKVIAEFIRWDDPAKNPQAKVKEIIGQAGDPAVEYESIIKEFKLPLDFPKEVKNEAQSIKKPVNRKYAGRLDLRNQLIITIDPATAKDFDDAVSLEKLENGNYLLGVHIADVSHYVKENSALDKEAFKRGNSIYLVDRVIPMLPEEISNVVCSLNPGETRFTFTVQIELDGSCKIVNYVITPSIIKSKRRYNYEEVQDIIDAERGDNAELIIELNKLATKLRKQRFLQGGINYDTQEIKYILDDNKIPVDVELNRTTEATSLIEECMLLANKVVATHVKKITAEFNLPTPIPFIYRIHDEPQQENLMVALEFIKNIGYKVNKKNITPHDINELLQKVKYKPENEIVNKVLIRAMSKAVYSDVNIGHYGLGFADYTHFTSPIRRYPDLMVHRLLKEYSLGKPDNDRLKELANIVQEAAQRSTYTERRATDAEHASNKLAGTILASSALGEVFTGTISGVQSYGVFVLLDQIYCEGLLHTRDMLDDYYKFDEKKMRITGKRTKKILTLGSQIRVRIAKVNIEKRQIDLVMEGE